MTLSDGELCILVSLTVWAVNQKKSELHPRKTFPGKTSEKGLKYCLSSASSGVEQ